MRNINGNNRMNYDSEKGPLIIRNIKNRNVGPPNFNDVNLFWKV
ncbi:hypothetical protein HME9304_00147 [Flagellimonas maritima]|uniref:Uncharacterized protein n=1 Tax=Flagellimonas maritima TaxID=1383885 RepID=A0A2Z4LN40_9FLAO|nr:hypothetical protein HME9304_00147 [Allomuricauda aurantiaca]